MTQKTDTTGNPEAEKIQTEIDSTIEKIEAQEAKVGNASTPAEESKEKDRLDSLLDKFDGLTERLGKIEERLAEPTVPAPEAKKEEAPPTAVASGSEESATPPVEERPRKRRLGAW